MILKKLTSNIISMMYLPIIEELNNKTSPYFMVTVSKQRLIKRIDLGDIINTTPSGIIYSKLNAGDMVCDILIAGMKSDIIVYTKSKALRIPLAEVPYQKRSTLGNLVMKTNDTIDGISVITSATKDVVVITANGRFNRINQSALPRSQRNKAGSRVIKLGKGDYIMNIFSCHGDDKVLRVIRSDEVVMINVNDIPEGSSVSTGAKLCKSGIIKVELINKDKQI
jgi:DNA gyrase/topoisomerase IV subunit A